MTKIPPAVSDYMRKIGAKGGRNGKGSAKRAAGAKGGKASGISRARKAALKKA